VKRDKHESAEGLRKVKYVSANERKLKEDYILRMIMRSELSVKDKITAIGEFAVPILRYSFGTVHWRLEET